MQVTQFIRRTIEHLLQVLKNPNRAPSIKIYLFYDNGGAIYPTINDICKVYRWILRQLTQVAQNLPSPETVLNISHAQKNLSVRSKLQ